MCVDKAFPYSKQNTITDTHTHTQNPPAHVPNLKHMRGRCVFVCRSAKNPPLPPLPTLRIRPDDKEHTKLGARKNAHTCTSYVVKRFYPRHCRHQCDVSWSAYVCVIATHPTSTKYYAQATHKHTPKHTHTRTHNNARPK